MIWWSFSRMCWHFTNLRHSSIQSGFSRSLFWCLDFSKCENMGLYKTPHTQQDNMYLGSHLVRSSNFWELGLSVYEWSWHHPLSPTQFIHHGPALASLVGESQLSQSIAWSEYYSNTPRIKSCAHLFGGLTPRNCLVFLLGASSFVSALYSRLNSLKRVAFVDLCKPQRAKTR